MRKSFIEKYPKLISLVVIIILAYIIFTNDAVAPLFDSIGRLGYLGTFIAGALIAFGFTAPIGVGLLIVLNPGNLLIASVIGAVGAMLSDLLIYRFVRVSFMDEFSRLEHTKTFKKIRQEIDANIGKKLKNYLLYILADLIIISPLPDEVGVTMLAGVTSIKEKPLMIISFFLHVLGIGIILYLAH